MKDSLKRWKYVLIYLAILSLSGCGILLWSAYNGEAVELLPYMLVSLTAPASLLALLLPDPDAVLLVGFLFGLAVNIALAYWLGVEHATRAAKRAA